MEYWSQVLSVFGLLAVILLILAGAYFFTRWAGQSMGGSVLLSRSGGRQLRVLERLAVGRDQAVLVVKAGQRYLLLGSTSAGLTLLAELTQEEGESWEQAVSSKGPDQKRPPDFRALMQRLREKK